MKEKLRRDSKFGLRANDLIVLLSSRKVCVPVLLMERRRGNSSNKRVVSRQKTHNCLILFILRNIMSYDETKHCGVSVDTATKKPNFTESAELFQATEQL